MKIAVKFQKFTISSSVEYSINDYYYGNLSNREMHHD